MQLARDIEVELSPEEEDDAYVGSKRNVFGLTRQTKSSLGTKFSSGFSPWAAQNNVTQSKTGGSRGYGTSVTGSKVTNRHPSRTTSSVAHSSARNWTSSS